MSQEITHRLSSPSRQHAFHSFDSTYYSLSPSSKSTHEKAVKGILGQAGKMADEQPLESGQENAHSPEQLKKGQGYVENQIHKIIRQEEQQSFDTSQRSKDQKKKEGCNEPAQIYVDQAKLFNIPYSKTQYHIAQGHSDQKPNNHNRYQLATHSSSNQQQQENHVPVHAYAHRSIQLPPLIQKCKAFPQPFSSLDSPLQTTYEKIYFPTTKCRNLHHFKVELSQPHQIDDEQHEINNNIMQISNDGCWVGVGGLRAFNIELHKIQQQEESYSTCRSGSIKTVRKPENTNKKLMIDIQQQQKLPLQSIEEANSLLPHFKIDPLKFASKTIQLKPNHINSSIYSKLEEIKLSNQYQQLDSNAKHHSLKKQNAISFQINSKPQPTTPFIVCAKQTTQNKYYTHHQTNGSASPVNNRSYLPYKVPKADQYLIQYQTQKKFLKVPKFSMYHSKEEQYETKLRTVKDKNKSQQLRSSYKKDLILKRTKERMLTQYQQPKKLFQQEKGRQHNSSQDKKGKISIMQRLSFNKKVSDFNVPHGQASPSFANKSQQKSKQKVRNDKSAQRQKIKMTLRQFDKYPKGIEPECEICFEYNKNEDPIGHKIR